MSDSQTQQRPVTHDGNGRHVAERQASTHPAAKNTQDGAAQNAGHKGEGQTAAAVAAAAADMAPAQLPVNFADVEWAELKKPDGDEDVLVIGAKKGADPEQDGKAEATLANHADAPLADANAALVSAMMSDAVQVAWSGPSDTLVGTSESFDGASADGGAEGFYQFGSGGLGGGWLLPVLGIAAAAVAVVLILDDDDSDGPNEAPILTVPDSVTIDENADANGVVVDAEVTDPDGDDVTFSLTGDDASAFTIDDNSGEVRFITSPDFEGQGTYAITVVATDDQGNAAQQDVTVTVTDIDRTPAFGNDQTEFDVQENVAVGTAVLTPDVTDPDGDDVTVTLTGDDADAFMYDEATGDVVFAASPDFETQDTYNFTVVAADPQGNQATQDITVNVENIADEPNEDFPTIFATQLADLTGEADYLAADDFYVTSFTDLNGSGVSGMAIAGFDDDTDRLTVSIYADGLEAGQMHAQHIHGFMADANGDVQDAMIPTEADDADDDGFIELAEGQDTYGPILLELTEDGGDFPMPGSDGEISYTMSFDLPEGDLGMDPMLDLREIVLHGMTLQEGQGANGGEADGTAGYKGVLPVAAGELEMVEAADATGVLQMLNDFIPPSNMT